MGGRRSYVNYTLGDNIEDLGLSGDASVGIGNTSDNVLWSESSLGASLFGMDGNDSLYGGQLDDYLVGGAGDDELGGWSGSDTMVGGSGNDAYWFAQGDGADVIQENDSTPENMDVIQFDMGISNDQLWFSQVGNDLNISIIGTSDSLLIQNWFLGSQYHVEEIQTWDGKQLLDKQVQNLVNAMAGMSPPPMGQTSLTETQQTVLAPVLVANWQ